MFEQFFLIRYDFQPNKNYLDSHYQLLFTYPRKETQKKYESQLFYLKDFCFSDVKRSDFILTKENETQSFIITQYQSGQFLYVFVSRTQDLQANTVDACVFISQYPFQKFFQIALYYCEMKRKISPFMLNHFLYHISKLTLTHLKKEKKLIIPPSRFMDKEEYIMISKQSFLNRKGNLTIPFYGFNSPLEYGANPSQNKLSNFIHLLIELIKPFKWEFPLISFTPEKLVANIQTPTALIMGIENSVYKNNLQWFSDENFFLFDLDKKNGHFQIQENQQNNNQDNFESIFGDLKNEKQFLKKEINDYKKKNTYIKKINYQKLQLIFQSYINSCLNTFQSIHLKENRLTQVYSCYLTQQKIWIKRGIASFKKDNLKAVWYKYIPEQKRKWVKLSNNLMEDLEIHYYYYLKHFLNKHHNKLSSGIKLDKAHVVNFDSMILSINDQNYPITR
ncbi:denn (aex-3) domain-containing protein [Anaeramoeba flamelloides]|uniref:Denn (Aex-3) domain-containing protein n=1 Tax=Anaeramoeba flamelloides TaxID=1746091 RepID=A0ABQ8Z2A8_9EUKA|nr:denn (aex-3) domain-containing protein [Anaeramoeba flamelloides]